MPDEVLAIIDELEEPVFTAKEVAKAGDVSRPTAHERLSELRERGVVDCKKVGSRAVAWWHVDAF